MAQSARIVKGTDGRFRVNTGRHTSEDPLTLDDVIRMDTPHRNKKARQVWVDEVGHMRVGSWKAAKPLTAREAFEMQEFAGKHTQAKNSTSTADPQLTDELDAIADSEVS